MPPGTQPASDPATRVHELLRLYSDPHTSVAHLLCDQHPANATAYTVLDGELDEHVLTYGELKRQSERLASALAERGIGPGDRVATLLGKSIEHLITLMGIWRLGAVHVPLFTAFAPPAIAARLLESNTKLVVCDEAQRPKLHPGRDIPDSPPWQIIVTGNTTEPPDIALADLLTHGTPGFPAAALGGSAPIVHMFTSGTTGRPKEVLVPTTALASFHAYMEFGLDLRPHDIFWNAADPSWGYGLYFGVLGSFCLGVPSVWLQGSFAPQPTLAALAQLGVTNFTAAPTVYRSLRASDADIPTELRIRCASAAGEPLTPEVNAWAHSALGVPVHDHYGQTETGMVINNHHHPALRHPLKTGSMGHPMPGWNAVVLQPDQDDVAPEGTLGRIAFDMENSPLAWFDGYLHAPEQSAEKFTANHRWYLTGDSAKQDTDGYFHFLSRDDDVIIMAGYRIGPFDVESVLLTHPSVTEAAVIAAPDAIRGEVLEAYLVLRDQSAGTPQLAAELQQLVKTHYAAHAYPRTVHFVPQLPKTPSGKIQRYLLRERRRAELGEATR